MNASPMPLTCTFVVGRLGAHHEKEGVLRSPTRGV
jgi:hypothetical protein